jgi:rod shape-determining protein MreB
MLIGVYHNHRVQYGEANLITALIRGLLRGLDKLLQHETQMPVYVASDPTSAVVLGTGKVLEELESNPMLRKVLQTAQAPRKR